MGMFEGVYGYVSGCVWVCLMVSMDVSEGVYRCV